MSLLRPLFLGSVSIIFMMVNTEQNYDRLGQICAATGTVQSPTVVRHIRRPISVSTDADLRHCQLSTSITPSSSGVGVGVGVCVHAFIENPPLY